MDPEVLDAVLAEQLAVSTDDAATESVSTSVRKLLRRTSSDTDGHAAQKEMVATMLVNRMLEHQANSQQGAASQSASASAGMAHFGSMSQETFLPSPSVVDLMSQESQVASDLTGFTDVEGIVDQLLDAQPDPTQSPAQQRQHLEDMALSASQVLDEASANHLANKADRHRAARCTRPSDWCELQCPVCMGRFTWPAAGIAVTEPLECGKCGATHAGYTVTNIQSWGPETRTVSFDLDSTAPPHAHLMAQQLERDLGMSDSEAEGQWTAVASQP
jgi:hypothetical protein